MFISGDSSCSRVSCFFFQALEINQEISELWALSTSTYVFFSFFFFCTCPIFIPRLQKAEPLILEMNTTHTPNQLVGHVVVLPGGRSVDVPVWWLVARVFGQSVGRPVGWSGGRPVWRSVSRSVGKFVGRSSGGRSVSRAVGGSVDLPACRVVGGSVDLSRGRSVGWLSFCLVIGLWVVRSIGLLVGRSVSQ